MAVATAELDLDSAVVSTTAGSSLQGSVGRIGWGTLREL